MREMRWVVGSRIKLQRRCEEVGRGKQDVDAPQNPPLDQRNCSDHVISPEFL